PAQLVEQLDRRIEAQISVEQHRRCRSVQLVDGQTRLAAENRILGIDRIHGAEQMQIGFTPSNALEARGKMDIPVEQWERCADEQAAEIEAQRKISFDGTGALLRAVLPAGIELGLAEIRVGSVEIRK